MAKKERPGFEEALTRLEEIVSRLEEESLSLEESVDLYEEGIRLSRQCMESLEEAELRIKKVHEQYNDNKDVD